MSSSLRAVRTYEWKMFWRPIDTRARVAAAPDTGQRDGDLFVDDALDFRGGHLSVRSLVVALVSYAEAEFSYQDYYLANGRIVPVDDANRSVSSPSRCRIDTKRLASG